MDPIYNYILIGAALLIVVLLYLRGSPRQFKIVFGGWPAIISDAQIADKLSELQRKRDELLVKIDTFSIKNMQSENYNPKGGDFLNSSLSLTERELKHALLLAYRCHRINWVRGDFSFSFPSSNPSPSPRPST